MSKFKVRLTADAIVSALLIVEAESEEAAKQWAIEHGTNEQLYEVDSLHEEPEVYNVRKIR